ncbi:hypothetical protein [Nocardioides zhouii]|uniref:Uncharacterized protein n=1 Tax=Nocardioides zhouii TaxID=1168729 RepID=A0A4Q2SJP0_9ACTN|nr:hypothetical protein [Nocardioides zhouii]RYC05622.1 hypothetical protein EUA94_17895 [Nocardioides zhouii]
MTDAQQVHELVVLDNDFVGSAPPEHYEGWSLADKAYEASAYWDAVNINVDNLLIRRFGVAAWSGYITELYASHQRQFFMPAQEKLGIPNSDPPAVRAAKYHLMSNALGGIRTRISVESSSKAWIIYLPATGAMGDQTFGEEHWLSIFPGWHARNGMSLGAPGLVFVATHMVSRGDPFTGGYFLDTGAPVEEPADRYRQAWGEPAPPLASRHCAELSSHDWPEDRRLKALRNFAVHWAWDRMATALEVFGAEVAADLDIAVAQSTYSHLPILAALSDEQGVHGVASSFAALLDMSGWAVEEVVADDGSVSVVVDRDPIADRVSQLPEALRSLPYQAVLHGWSGAAAEMGAKIVLSNGSKQTWKFERDGAS